MKEGGGEEGVERAIVPSLGNDLEVLCKSSFEDPGNWGRALAASSVGGELRIPAHTLLPRASSGEVFLNCQKRRSVLCALLGGFALLSPALCFFFFLPASAKFLHKNWVGERSKGCKW